MHILAIQKFKCDTIILVTEIESSKSSSKPYTLLLAMFWSLNFYPTLKKNVLIGWKGQAVQRKPDAKIRGWQFDPEKLLNI